MEDAGATGLVTTNTTISCFATTTTTATGGYVVNTSTDEERANWCQTDDSIFACQTDKVTGSNLYQGKVNAGYTTRQESVIRWCHVTRKGSFSAPVHGKSI